MVRFILSLFLGMFPEVLFMTLSLIYTKNIKEKKFKLGILISLIYLVCIMLQTYKTAYYIAFIVLTYMALKLLYKEKTQIIDIFIISLFFIYITCASYICFLFLKKDLSNYYMLMILDRIILFASFLFRNKYHSLYKLYCKLWNRNDNEKRPIKSITLRNISLIVLNSFIFALNIFTIYIINLSKQGGV